MIVKELNVSKSFSGKNLDSIAIFDDGYNRGIIVTAKATDSLVTFDFNLKYKNEIKSTTVDYYDTVKRTPVYVTYEKKKFLNRPNGIAIDGGYCYVVERDSGLVKCLYIATSFSQGSYLVGTFGNGILNRPYGIALHPDKGHCYVTDNNLDDGVGMVYIFRINNITRKHADYKSSGGCDGGSTDTFTFDVKLVKSFGSDILGSVESISIYNEKIYVADESKKNIFIFDLKGTLLRTLLKEPFKYDPEGIDFWRSWLVCTEQGPQPSNNKFHIFKDDKYIGNFYGNETKNTDGIAIDKESGIMFAIDDDIRVTSFDLKEALKDQLSLQGLFSVSTTTFPETPKRSMIKFDGNELTEEEIKKFIIVSQKNEKIFSIYNISKKGFYVGADILIEKCEDFFYVIPNKFIDETNRNLFKNYYKCIVTEFK